MFHEMFHERGTNLRQRGTNLKKILEMKKLVVWAPPGPPEGREAQIGNVAFLQHPLITLW